MFSRLRKIHGRAFVIALLVLYLPQTWIVWDVIKNYPPADVAMLLPMFPALPGGIVGAVIRTLYWNQFQELPPFLIPFTVALVFSLMLIVILTIIGSRGKAWQIAAIILGGGYSIIAAIAMHAGFQM